MDKSVQPNGLAWGSEMFRLLAENIPDYAIVVVDPDRRILCWGLGAERLFGYAEGEIVGRPSDGLYAPEDVQQGVPQRQLEQARASGRHQGERWQVRKDGSQFWAKVVAVPFQDAAGSLQGFLQIVRERTEPKQADDAIHERNRQLHLLTDRAPVLIAHCGIDRRFRFVNKPYAARFGLHPRDVVGRRIRDVVGESAYAVIERHLDAVFAGERVVFEAELPYEGLGPQVMRCAYDPEFDDEGRVTGFVAAIQNVTEERRASEALRISEDRFARFMQHLPGLAWIKDSQGRYVFANDAAVRAFQKTRQELYGMCDEDVFPPETAAQFRANDQEALASGAGVQVVETLLHDDGVLHHSLVSKFPILGPDGEAVLMGGMAIDLTEQMRTRAVLQESEERFRQLAENVREVFWVSDPRKTQMLYISPAYEDVWGRSCQSLYDHPHSFLDGIHPDDRDRVLDDSLARQGRGEAADVEYRVVRPDGSMRWVRDRSFPVRDASGRVFRIVGIADDITDRKQAEEALRESEGRLRTLSDNLPLGAVYQVQGEPDGQRRFLYVSAGIERIFGVTPAEIMADALALYGLVHEADRPSVTAAEEVSIRDLSPFDCEFRSWTRRGEIRWIHCRSAPRQVASGQLVWEGIVMGVTDRRRAEDELRAADKRKDEFLATLAHELRNPLAPIRNGLHLLRLAGDNRAVTEKAHGVMERQLQLMVRLIDDLLDVSRISRGKLRLQRERVELASVVQNAVENSRPHIEAAGHELTVSLPPEPVYLDADATRLAQVFGNLLTNAAKYTDRGGAIRLTAERTDGGLVVAVRDTGIGIDAEHLPRLFEMFSQAHSALERSQGGLGIGLSLVKGLVEMHGGTVEARSEGVGRGSEFVVWLPLPVDAPPLELLPPSHGEPASTRTRQRILVADDNQDSADSLAVMLRLAGHDVHAAYDGQEAVEMARTLRPVVVLLDIGMPKVNGYEAARRIRGEAWGKKMILVAITGWGQDEDKRLASEAGFDHHLTKPVAPADLELLLARLPHNG